MSNLYLAFLLGLFGSLHCAVMCGPLVLSLPTANSSKVVGFIQLLLYQFGRIFTYVAFGIAAGLLGNALGFFVKQEYLSFIIGGLLIIFALLHFFSKKISLFNRLQNKLLNFVSLRIGQMYQYRFWGFYIGVLNGLIPCGMVYLALASALNNNTIQGSASFMFMFGLGTTPIMLAISLGGIYLKRYFRFNTNKLLPWFMLFLGVLFIARAAELGIPYLSPNHHLHYGVGAECR